MSEACQYIHKKIQSLPRYRAGFDIHAIPKNGLYFLFENGEAGHGAERIVRVGTHRGQDNLGKRIMEHLFAKNKDRSIFRKHVGRCLLAKAGDSFLSQWEIDLTTKAAREKHEGQIDKKRLLNTELAVSNYMNENFSFTVMPVSTVEQRLIIEECCISTIAACNECRPSKSWLGLHHPNAVIRQSGLWNVQGLDGRVFGEVEAREIFENTASH